MRKFISTFQKIDLMKYGLMGFSFFFGIIIIAKYINNIYHNSTTLIIEADDIIIGVIGFLLFVLIRIINKISNLSNN